MMVKRTYAQAIGDALKEEMRRDDAVILYGEDVAEHGGIFGVTRGILDEFGPERIKSTPISETAIVGSAAGAAAVGLRPCVEIMYGDFLTVCYSEIVHVCAKWRYMHGAEYKLPLVIRCAQGSSFGAGPEHSNCVESLFMRADGLTLVCPSTVYDAKGLMKSAVRSDNPVLFFEHKQLYKTSAEIPDEEYTVPLGVADVKRQGSDVTVIAISLMVQKALEAAKAIEKDGIDVEVIDPRTILPLDKKTIFASVKKTHRVVIVEEGSRRNGVGAELSAMIQESLFDELDAPVTRVAAHNVPVPYNLALESYVLPNTEKIIGAVKSLF